MAGSKDDVVWAVLDENETPISVSGIHAIDWIGRNGRTGTVLGDRSVWGKGYGTDVMRTRTRWAFEDLGLHRLQSECYVENAASKRCLEKTGLPPSSARRASACGVTRRGTGSTSSRCSKRTGSAAHPRG